MKPIVNQLTKIEEEVTKIIVETHDDVLENRKNPFEIVGYNNAGQKTMLIDKMIEDSVHECLNQLGIKGLLLAEEYGSVRRFGTELLDERELVVILDPIDGSENLKRYIPYYSSAVALGLKPPEKGEVTFSDLFMGVVVDFPLETIVKSTVNKGVFVSGAKNRFYDLNFTVKSTNTTVCGYFRVGHGPTVMKSMKTIFGSFSLRNMGSVALEIVHAALKKFDMFFDFRNRLNAYDIAASIVIAKELGAHVIIYPERALDSVPLSLSRKYSLVVAHDKNLITSMENALGGAEGIRSIL